MGRRNNSWGVECLRINFNQKQWRQDLGYFVKRYFGWIGDVRVTKALGKRGRKSFQIYNEDGQYVEISYQDQNKVDKSKHSEMINKYFDFRNKKIS